MATNVQIPPELDALAELLTQRYSMEHLAQKNAGYSLYKLKNLSGESVPQVFSICNREAFNEIQNNLHNIKPEIIAEKIKALKAITPSLEAKPFLDGYINAFEMLGEAQKTNPEDIVKQMEPFISKTDATYVRVGPKITMVGRAEDYADLLSSHANLPASDKHIEFRASVGDKLALESIAKKTAIETNLRSAAAQGEQAAAKVEEASQSAAVNTERVVPVNSGLPKAEQAAEGLWKRFRNMHGGKQAAIIGIPVAAAAGLGYWVLREKNKDNETQKPVGSQR